MRFLNMSTLLRENPMAFADMGRDKVAILEAHVEYLAAQAEQYGANAQIGREGAARSGAAVA